MDAIWQAGISFIQAVQSMGGPALDAIFKAITSMGEEEFFLVLLPMIFWCVDSTVGLRLIVTFLLSTYVNTGLKDIIQHPRPPESLHKVEIGGHGLPSGHSQSAVVVWGGMATEFRKRWLWVIAILAMLLIGFSRIYLGVHFPTDVLGGWAIGAVILAVYPSLAARIETWLKRVGLVWQLALAVIVPLVLLLLHPVKDVGSSMSVLMGLGVGAILCRQVAPYSAAGPLGQRAARFVVGLIGVFVLYLGLSAVFPGEGQPLYFSLRAVRYALVGLWASLGAPWVFLRLRLAANG